MAADTPGKHLLPGLGQTQMVAVQGALCRGRGSRERPPTLHCYSALPAPDMPPPPTWALVLRHLSGPPQEGGVLWTSRLAHRLTHSGAGSLWPHAWRLEFRN